MQIREIICCPEILHPLVFTFLVHIHSSMLPSKFTLIIQISLILIFAVLFYIVCRSEHTYISQENG